jgi:hypothetical protein
VNGCVIAVYRETKKGFSQNSSLFTSHFYLKYHSRIGGGSIRATDIVVRCGSTIRQAASE